MATRAHTVPKFLLEGFCSTNGSGDGCRQAFLWIGSIATGRIERRAPRNVGLHRGLYDGAGGFEDAAKTIEAHLGKIENNAAIAIRRLATAGVGSKIPIPEIFRFLAWQAARTPGWMEVERRWVDELGPAPASATVPAILTGIKERARPLTVENLQTAERRAATNEGEFRRYLEQGWKWVPSLDDKLEMMHLQAWYFQQVHFPRLTWMQLRPSNDEDFIIGDRGVAWLVDGYADMPPGALDGPGVEVIAPLTRRLVLLGRESGVRAMLTPREVNLRTAFATSNWIAGPTMQVVQQALKDRASASELAG